MEIKIVVISVPVCHFFPPEKVLICTLSVIYIQYFLSVFQNTLNKK